MTETLTPNLRKAAVLIRSLDSESAAVLLAQLSADEAKAVRQAIRELGEVEPEEQEQLRTALRSEALREGEALGVELDFSSGIDRMQVETGRINSEAPTISVPQPSAHDQPFAWLDGGDLPSLAIMLEREHLSTIAVVLSHLPPASASEVLAALSPSRRAAAIERLADLGDSDRASLEVIERELADWIATQKAERQRRADRLQVIQAILQHSSPGTCQDVLREIADHDQTLAREIGPIRNSKAPRPVSGPARPIAQQAAALEHPPLPSRQPANSEPVAPTPKQPAPREPHFDFDDVSLLTRGQLAELFRHCAGEKIVLALAGAQQPLIEHVERMLPRSVVKELRRRMHALSSVRLSDFAAAQDDVAKVAGRMFGQIAR